MKRTFVHILRQHLVTVVLMATAGASLLGSPGCNHTAPEENRQVIIFIDMSLSTLPDREHYKKYIENVVAKLKAGDRLTICKILDLTIAEFTPILDVKYPDFNFWSDNRTRYEKAVREIRNQAMTTVDSVLDSRFKVQKSEIINSFLICDQLMRGKDGKKSLIIISDMQESSSDFDFDRDELTPFYIDRALTSLKEKGRVPKLNQVEIWIAGAYSKETEKYFAVQEFWRRYIEATGATLRSYSHTLLDFE